MRHRFYLSQCLEVFFLFLPAAWRLFDFSCPFFSLSEQCKIAHSVFRIENRECTPLISDCLQSPRFFCTANEFSYVSVPLLPLLQLLRLSYCGKNHLQPWETQSDQYQMYAPQNSQTDFFPFSCLPFEF